MFCLLLSLSLMGGGSTLNFGGPSCLNLTVFFLFEKFDQIFDICFTMVCYSLACDFFYVLPWYVTLSPV